MVQKDDNGSRSAERGTEATPASPATGTGWKTIYWLLPLFLGGLQVLVTVTSMHQIRYEELAESVRNVYWLEHRLIYDGISSNVGWYGTLLAVYKLCGFSLYSAKFVRLGLHLIGLYCVAELLRRRMGVRTAIVPLVVIGLSPTLLYLNTFQTSYGTELPHSVICLLLLLSVRFHSPAMLELGKTFLCGVLAMVAAMSYPTFLFYLPSLLLVFVCRLKKEGLPGPRLPRGWKSWHILSGVAGFFLPLLAALLFLRTPQLLIYDPATQAGLFRGGGRIGFDPVLLNQSVETVLRDLFVRGDSYYFELTRPDFSGYLAITSLSFVAATTICLLRTRKTDRTLLWATALLLAVNLIVPNLSTGGLPGIRRCTGVLAAGFVLFALVWDFYGNTPFKHVWLRRGGILLCLLLPCSSALKFPSLLSDAAKLSTYRDNQPWFVVKQTPTESLDYLLAGSEKGLVLGCRDEEGKIIIPCRYQEIYSAIAGYRLWNGLTNVEIQALDWKTGGKITLSPSLWTEYYFPH